jgi:hypothetical protein
LKAVEIVHLREIGRMVNFKFRPTLKVIESKSTFPADEADVADSSGFSVLKICLYPQHLSYLWGIQNSNSETFTFVEPS